MPDAFGDLRPTGAGKLRVCVIGGTPAHRGGLESFCERAVAALRTHAPQIDVCSLTTETAYLRPYSLWRIARRLHALVGLRREVDLVWLQVSNLPDLLYLGVARMLGVRVLATPHFGANSRLQKRRWRRAICRAALGKANLLGLLFEGQGAEIALPPVRTVTLGTFLPLAAFADAHPSEPATEPLRLVHAARFSVEKGTFATLDLCASLRDRGVSFQAQLIGRAEQTVMADIRARIADLRLGGQVAFSGWLDEAATQEALRQADVLVHLSSIDSFPLIVLEALAAGTLPVVRDMVGARYMVERLGGHIVTEQCAIADACDWICDLGAKAIRQEGAAARKRTHDVYGWARMVAGLELAFSQAAMAEP